MTTPEPNFVDDPKAPEWFVDDVAGGWLSNGVVRFTVMSARVDHSSMPGPVSCVVVGRLVMTIAAAENFAKLLQQHLDWIREAASAPKGDATDAPPQVRH